MLRVSAALSLVPALLASGCTRILDADFSHPVWVVGAPAVGGLPGGSNADVATAVGNVTIVNDSGTGLGKHAFIDSSPEEISRLSLIPDPTGPTDHYLFTARGYRDPSAGTLFLVVYSRNEAQEPVIVASVGIGIYRGGAPWFGLYGNPYTSSLPALMDSADVLHSIFLRLDNVTHRAHLMVQSETANGTLVSEMVSEAILPFGAVTEVAVLGSSQEYGPDYHLGRATLSSWSELQHSRAVETARQQRLIPRRSGRATAADERVMLETAFQASPSQLSQWLPPQTVSLIADIRP